MTQRARKPAVRDGYKDLSTEILEICRRRWDGDISPPALGYEEYSDGAAIEVVLNEMLDRADAEGLRVQTVERDRQVSDLIVG